MKTFPTIIAPLAALLSLVSAAPLATRQAEEALIEFFSATGVQFSFVTPIGSAGFVPVDTPFSVVSVATSAGFDYCGLQGNNGFYQAVGSASVATIGPPQVITGVACY